MRKPSAPTITEPAPDGWTYLGIAVFLPALAGYSLYLAGDYFALLQLIHMPGFWSLNPFQASFVACGPAMLLFCVLGNVKLFLSATLPIPLARRLITAIAWLTLGLLFTLNALTLFLHFSYFSPDRYIRCWEPFPWGTWHYARTASICEQHGLAPVQFLNPHSSAENAVAP